MFEMGTGVSLVPWPPILAFVTRWPANKQSLLHCHALGKSHRRLRSLFHSMYIKYISINNSLSPSASLKYKTQNASLGFSLELMSIFFG